MFHLVVSKWFVVGELAELTVKVMLSVNTGVGYGSGIPRTASLELPGGPRRFQNQ